MGDCKTEYVQDIGKEKGCCNIEESKRNQQLVNLPDEEAQEPFIFFEEKTR